jgi:hypothetical protein
VQTSARLDSSESALLVRAGELRTEIAGHKRAIRQRREDLAAAKTALVEIEARCRELGIRFIVQE